MYQSLIQSSFYRALFKTIGFHRALFYERKVSENKWVLEEPLKLRKKEKYRKISKY